MTFSVLSTSTVMGTYAMYSMILAMYSIYIILVLLPLHWYLVPRTQETYIESSSSATFKFLFFLLERMVYLYDYKSMSTHMVLVNFNIRNACYE